MKREILNTMVNYNDKTIQSMGMYLSKKIGIPSTTELNCIEWNHNSQFIATGGVQGTLKVVKLESSTDAVKGSNNLSVNQALDGHSASIVCATWNETYQKLTTSDTSGLIIVWGMHNDSWFEEMINNRNKSTVVGMGWNCDGTKIAIAYADGQVIVGTLEGNRIWNKDLPNALAACEWAPDGMNLLFGTTEGEVHVYDGTGTFVQKIHMVALDSVELVTALSRDLKREKIICIKWYTPVIKSKLVQQNDKRLDMAEEPPKIVEIYTFEQSENESKTRNYMLDRPRLLVAYAHGVIQLMRAENDPSPIVCRFPNFTLTSARWSPNGAFIAVTGFQTDMPKSEQAIIHVVSSFGKMISFLRVKETSSLTGVAWDPNGLRIAITTDYNIYFGNIRPQYKWGYIARTVVYTYEKENEKNQFSIIFYETKLDEIFSKTVQGFEQIACFDDYCVIVNRQEDQNGTFFAQLCNGIGTALDFKYTNVDPHCVALNGIAAVIAGGETYYIWHFVLPKFNSVQSGVHVPGKEGTYVLENHPVGSETGGRRRFGRGNDAICALCMADTYFYAACDSGALFKISLTDGAVLQRYSIPQNILSMELNCTFTRMATLDNNNILQIFEIGETTLNKISGLERRDVWSYKWDAEKEDMIALNEKAKMIVLKGNTAEEPVLCSGYICSFKGLIVRTVLVDNFLLKPDRPEKRFVHEIEIKSLRDVKNLLDRRPHDAMTFIEKNPHPRLWSLLAETSLNKLDIETAEHGYVKLRDYAGIHFCKKLENVANDELRKAEVFMHLSEFAKAEKIFLQHDRRDLALTMYMDVHDWPQVVRLLTSEDDETVKHNALMNVGDYYYERLDWRKAAEKYAQCNALEKRIDSLVRGSILGELEALVRTLPDQHEFLEKIGDVFSANGMCEQAVECYIRCGLVERALACCIELNFWEKANHIAKTNNLADVDAMLSKYAENLTGASNEKSLSALQLYRRAGRLLDAAKIAFDIAKDEHRRAAPPTRVKKIYVMGALLVEQMHTQKTGNKGKQNARRLLEDTLNEEMDVSIEESRIMESAWKGAEAFHFLLLAHDHLYKGNSIDGLRTALVLTEYEEFIEASEIYSLIALTSANVKQFSICSKAMMRLESLKDFSEDEKAMMRDLSMSLFNQFPPNEQQAAKITCPGCASEVKDFELSCPKCDIKFPICIASGRMILDNRFWMCMTCKHRAYEHEIDRFRCCPLCHSTQSFKK